jgi:hypothetical protein
VKEIGSKDRRCDRFDRTVGGVRAAERSALS